MIDRTIKFCVPMFAILGLLTGTLWVVGVVIPAIIVFTVTDPLGALFHFSLAGFLISIAAASARGI